PQRRFHLPSQRNLRKTSAHTCAVHQMVHGFCVAGHHPIVRFVIPNCGRTTVRCALRLFIPTVPRTAHGGSSHDGLMSRGSYSCSTWCTKEMAVEPSPTAEATR